MVLGRTTRLPRALRDELGLPAASQPGRGRGRGGSFSSRGRGVSSLEHGRKPRTADARSSRIAGLSAISKGKQRENPQGEGRQDSSQHPRSATRKGRALEGDTKHDRERTQQAKGSRAEERSRVQQKGVPPERTTALERLLNTSGAAASEARRKSTTDEDDTHRSKRRKMTQQERDEEDEIAWLEAHLGGRRKKQSAAKATAAQEEEETVGGGDDGLDDLLGELDKFYPGMYGDGSREEDAGSEDESDEESSSEGETDSDEQEAYSDASGSSVADPLPGELSDASSGPQSSTPASLSNPPPPVTGKYLPPAARAAAAATNLLSSRTTETDQKLRRQANGLLNKLGEGNLASILADIEGLYRSHPRAAVTNILSDLVIANVSSASDLIDTFLILQAALVVALHRIIGVEFAAQVLQAAVDRLLRARTEALDMERQGQMPGKEAANIVGLLAGMYNLGSLAHPLMYDFMRLFLNEERGPVEGSRLSEADVELLLRLVKSCGAALRHDDPTALRAIIHLAHKKTAAIEERTGDSSFQAADSSQNVHVSTARVRFMLDALSDLKNNRTKAAAALESSPAGQSLNRLRKYISSLARTRTLRSHDALRVGLQDLRDAETRGKWWLVGAAWAGQEGNESASGVTASRPLRRDRSDEESKESKLLLLARAQGMNTEARRSIFVTIMSGEDYVDASNRLLGLKLVEAQRRETIRVLLHCIGAEPSYNPYYVLIGIQLSTDSPSTRVTMQYCLWDFLRSLGERHVGGKSIVHDAAEDSDEEDVSDEDAASGALRERKLANLARAYAWWIAKGALSLNVLKTVSFATLKSKGARFLQHLIAHLLLSTQASSPLQTLCFRSSTAMRSGAGDKRALEEVIVSGTMGNPDLSRGLLYFIDAHVAKKSQIATLVGEGEEMRSTRQRLLWAANTAKEVLSVGATIRPF